MRPSQRRRLNNLDYLGNRVSALHVFIVVMSFAMTLGAWLYSRQQVQSQIEARFEAARDRTVGLIADRMSRYEDALRSGVANIESNDGHISYEGWKAFARSLDIRQKYPGVNGIGVISYVDRPDLPAYLAERTVEPREFAIYPEHRHDVLLPITFIEPEDINAAAIGLDVAHEKNRRTALLASRDTGTAQITGPIVLVQDSGHTPGFLFYTPFYRGGAPATVAERRERFAGVVYAPFIVKKLVDGLLSKDLREVRFSIRDGGASIYDEHEKHDVLHDDDPMFSEVVELEMYGRRWLIDVRTNLAFRAQNHSQQPTLILAGGLIIEILIVSLLSIMMRSNQRAHEYAHQLTRELRSKTESLESANAEIEQFAYVASHDLKTPVRGISYLTDLLEEDLENLLGPVDGHDAIKSHLQLIRDRVRRMNDLTAGIMRFSRVGHMTDEDGSEASIGAIIDDCMTDIGIRPDQIRLEGPGDPVPPDNHGFRRVMENLIGNAVKYHPRPDEGQFRVLVEDLGDRLKVAVRDDGDGIAPEFHAKVFDVFQTLRTADAPDSTGIGLSIVRKAVRRHGHDVSLTSEPGKGAEFVFEWPAATDDIPGDAMDKVA